MEYVGMQKQEKNPSGSIVFVRHQAFDWQNQKKHQKIGLEMIDQFKSSPFGTPEIPDKDSVKRFVWDLKP